MSISKLYLDELAFVRSTVQEEMWNSILPTLSSGGSCIVSSTPNGDTDLFSSLWRGAESGINGFAPFRIDWDRPPGRDEAFKNKMIPKIGPVRWSQEYECNFVSSDELLIDTLLLTRLNNEVMQEPLFELNGFKFYKEIQPRHTYYVSCDISSGIGNDFATIEVVDSTTMEQVAEFYSNTVNPNMLYIKEKWICNYILEQETAGFTPECYWSYESNGVGAAFTSLYLNDENPTEAMLLSTKDRFGIFTSNTSKIKACMDLKNVLEKKYNKSRLKIYSPRLLNELKNYVRKGVSFAAKTSATDDCVAAMLNMMHMFELAHHYDDGLFQKMYTYDEDTYHVNDADEDSEDPMPMIF